MAALRIFSRSVISASRLIVNNDQHTCKYVITPIIQINKRFANFRASPAYSEDQKYTDYEISQDPTEWRYVERLFRPKHIPIPPKNLEVSASGWKSPKDEAKKFPFFVNRTKNHLYPVYLTRKNRFMRRLTVVRKIDGDIVALEAELRQFIENSINLRVASQISEPGGVIKFRGDYVNLIIKWLEKNGF
ncbi:hypothetical protein PV325_000344 [Microctonus aethiopoides]|uniref:Large ribosomal subunit protein mL49 n=1 Tax=Microctonus aethiopoides TaxID=144406 RepID=A0AA39C5I4_9HYME|nr:hypothetical protein PV325_000344 [Microctonus aethiopoides]KAK0094248.1 hypothetical protein PV326_011437 [Microctonus aethiopoides]KAK0158305.1 hypothetical protein PV328_009324 [Microctonus aethiopoides]